MREALKSFVKAVLPKSARLKLRKLLMPGKRPSLGRRYLVGNGIEIGGLGSPTPVGAGATLTHVDYVDEKELTSRYPEQGRLKRPDFVEDGFVLPSFSEESVDFVVANHVLEHSPNPIAGLRRWAEVVRPGGVLFVTVPIVDRCFDVGRATTVLQHLIEDFELSEAGAEEEMRRRNREHYAEFIDIFNRNAFGRKYVRPSAEERGRMIEDHVANAREIHFHTFTARSYREFLEYFCQAQNPRLSIVEVVENDNEVIGILRKRA